jgi:hypothetical protein
MAWNKVTDDNTLPILDYGDENHSKVESRDSDNETGGN